MRTEKYITIESLTREAAFNLSRKLEREGYIFDDAIGRVKKGALVNPITGTCVDLYSIQMTHVSPTATGSWTIVLDKELYG